MSVQPTTGVIGIHRKSTVYRMIQPSVLFPRGYLWQVEQVGLLYLLVISLSGLSRNLSH